MLWNPCPSFLQEGFCGAEHGKEGSHIPGGCATTQLHPLAQCGALDQHLPVLGEHEPVFAIQTSVS